jgi:uncharacterized protein (DUF2141 family)
MKPIIIPLFIVLAGTKISAHQLQRSAPIDSNTYTLNVLVKGLSADKKYTLYIQLLNASHKTIQQKRVPIETSELTVSFEKLPKGKYAVRYFQDENGNGKMDKNILGIPKEGWGYSNDARDNMSAPKIEDALFDFTGTQTIIINK